MLHLVLTLVLGVSETALAKPEERLETRSYPCTESDYAFYRNSRFCVDDREPILWEFDYEGDHAVWRGTPFRLPSATTVRDISHFWALDPSTFVIGFHQGDLWGYKDETISRLESTSEVVSLKGGQVERQFLYLTAESLGVRKTRYRVTKLDDQMRPTTLWESQDYQDVSLGGYPGYVLLFLDVSESATERWKFDETESEWFLDGVLKRVPLEPDLSRWVEVEPYPEWPAELSLCPSHSMSGPWKVVQTGQGASVARPDYQDRVEGMPFWIRPRFGRQSAMKVPRGYLVALDKGEFGGSIWWYSDDGAERHEIVSRYNVLGFADTGSETVAVQGLSHLTFSGGSIVRLGQDEKGTWRVVGEVDLGIAPQAFLVESDGSVTIATRGGLLRYHHGVVEEVPTSDYFDLAINSIVRDGTDLLLGMRHAVIRLTPDGEGYRATWFAPPGCPRLVRTAKNTCECAPLDSTSDGSH